MRASRGLKWENKMYKLKRSIIAISTTPVTIIIIIIIIIIIVRSITISSNVISA